MSTSNNRLPTSQDVPDDVAEALAAAAHRLGPFQARLIWYDETGSTNDVAATMAQGGAPEGTVVAANAQTSGRGRLGRAWSSPTGAGLYVSIVLRPQPHVLPLLTIAAGVAIADGIETATGMRAGLKWPNDLVVGRRKLGGILSEAASLAAGSSLAVDRVIVGFGINLLTAAYPPDVDARATSIERELGRRPDRGLVLAECLAAFAATYRALQDGLTDGVLTAWRARAAGGLGRHVEWTDGGGLQRGVAQDVDAAGALLVRTGDTTVRIISGEVRWL